MHDFLRGSNFYLITTAAVVGVVTLHFTLPAATQSASLATPTASAWTINGHIKPTDIIVQSHRGAGELAPENTKEAFELGWKLGTIPEADLRTTTDSQIVAFHDAAFERVVQNVPAELKGKGVKDVTWAELSKLDVGAWAGSDFVGRRVSLMDEIFSLMAQHPERRIYLDIKNVHLPDLAVLVKKHGVEKQVILAAPKHQTLLEWRRLVPESDTLLWVGGSLEQITAKFNAAAKTGFQGITQLQIHTHLSTGTTNITRDAKDPFVEPDNFLIDAGNQLRKHGVLYQTLTYGGASREIHWKLLDLGLMSFATDHPDMTKEAIAEYYKLAPLTGRKSTANIIEESCQ
jgi:glycerophosphoryl diester phosphodiesterase